MKPFLKMMTPPSRSAARNALAAAIRDLAHDEAQSAAALEAVQRGHRLADSARAALQLATDELNIAIETSAARTAAALSEDRGLVPDNAARDARLRQADAVDQLDSALAAVRQLEANYESQGYGIGVARRRRDEAADAVIREEAADKLMREVIELRARLVAKTSELTITEPWMFPWNSQTGDNNPAKSVLFRGYDFEISKEHPAAKVWSAARAALLTDADAVLPI